MRESPAGGCTHGKVVAMAAAVLLAVFGAVAETRIGIIGLDTSHAVAFTKVINVDRPPWTEGFRVTSAYQWGSRDIFSSTNRYPEYIAKVREMGVAVVPTIDELIESVDVVCLETNDGREHFWQAEKVFAAGKPCFIDKPIAHNLADAVRIYDLARSCGAKYFSSSALRYTDVAKAARAGKYGPIRGASLIAPSPDEEQGTHNFYTWYGIHGFEPLVAIMGTGVKTVSCVRNDDGDSVCGVWNDGRIGQLRLQRNKWIYSGYILPERPKDPKSPLVVFDDYKGYEPLLEEIIRFFRTGEPPVPNDETLEIMAFMEAAEMSAKRGGAVVSIDEAMAAARGEDGFVPMFNGRDLAGWEGATNTYCVMPEGYLTCTQSDGIGESGAKNLWTTRDYTNFTIRFDVKLPPNANNGLGIRTPPNGWCSREGMELQLLDDWGDLYNGSNRLADVHYTGAIYGVVAPARKVNGDSYLKKPGEWNSVEVTADGPRVKFVLNGSTLVDADVSQYSTDGTVPADGIRRPGLHNKSGRIHWCGHGHNIFWRNIRIKEIR